jgi:hypothetical protein
MGCTCHFFPPTPLTISAQTAPKALTNSLDIQMECRLGKFLSIVLLSTIWQWEAGMRHVFCRLHSVLFWLCNQDLFCCSITVDFSQARTAWSKKHAGICKSLIYVILFRNKNVLGKFNSWNKLLSYFYINLHILIDSEILWQGQHVLQETSKRFLKFYLGASDLWFGSVQNWDSTILSWIRYSAQSVQHFLANR